MPGLAVGNLESWARLLEREPYVRNARMRRLRDRGWTLARIGSEYGLTRERVRQVLLDQTRRDERLRRRPEVWYC
jgi:DNA-directed RNA polymerase sigma subunit (sigma70/sigma32)